MKTTFIYALIDPRNDHIRYIGKAKESKEIRANEGKKKGEANTKRLLK